MIQIADCQIELLSRDPHADLPEGQAQTCRLLLELAEGTHALQSLMQASKLRSPLPFWARLRHLETRGLLRMTSTTLVKV